MPPKKKLEFDSYYSVRAEPVVQYQQVPQPSVTQFNDGPYYPNYQPMIPGVHLGTMGQFTMNAHPAPHQQGLPVQCQNHLPSATPIWAQPQYQATMASSVSMAAIPPPKLGTVEQQRHASVNSLPIISTTQMQSGMGVFHQQPSFPVSFQAHPCPSARFPPGRSKEKRKERKLSKRAKNKAPSASNGVTEQHLVQNAAQIAAKWQHTNGHVGSIHPVSLCTPSTSLSRRKCSLKMRGHRAHTRNF
jgi:hypothetical protein